MACENKKTRRLSIIILCLMFCGLPLVAPRNIDCKGKPFHCVNSTHFIICVDLGGGISSTVDDVIIPCPESTICDINNHFECEFPPPTTLTLPIQPSDVSNDSGLGKYKVITKVSWENIDITTTSSVQKTSERSEKYLNNASITIPEEFTTTKAKLEAITDGQSTTIHQDNINRQSNNNEKQYQQFTGNSMIEELNNLNVAQSDVNKNGNTKGTKSNSYTIDIRPTQTNEQFKDRKLSSLRSGTESTPQHPISSPEITEFYSSTPGNRDVTKMDSSFTTNSEMPTSDVMSAETPVLSNSRSKGSKILESEKETTTQAVTAGTTTERKKTSTVEPKVITLSYNRSQSPSQINNDNSTAKATLNESNPVNFLNESINSTTEAKTSRKIDEYQHYNPSNDIDKISYFNEVSATESFTNITPKVSEKYLQSNSTQDHLSSIVSVNKYLESERLNYTIEKYEPKNTTNIIGDTTTRPNTTDVQRGSANQENSDMSVSNPIEILPATDSSIFPSHKQDRVRNKIKKGITKTNIHDETTMSDLSTNYYVTDSYGVNYDQSTKTFDVRNFNKNSYTNNTFGTDEFTATTTEKNNDIITTVLHNNTETTRANQSSTTFLDNSSAVISPHDKPEEDIVWDRTQTKITVPYNHNGTAISEYDSKNYVVNSDNKTHQQPMQTLLEQSKSTTKYDSKSELTLKHSNTSFTTTEQNIKTVTTAFPDYKMSKTHEQILVANEPQKSITKPYVYNGTNITNFSNNYYVNDNSYSNNQYKSTQAMGELNSTKSDDSKNENTIKNSKKYFVDDESLFTTIEPNVGVITTTNLNYMFMNNKEIAKKESGIFHNNASSGFENQEVILTTTKPDIETIKNAPNYNLNINKEAKNNSFGAHEKSTVMHEIQKNITTSFIHGEKAMTGLNDKSYAKDDSSSRNQFHSTQTTNSVNDEFTTSASNIYLITPTVPNYNYQQNKDESIKFLPKTHEEGVVKHESKENITTLFIQGGKAMSDLNNESYVKEDSSSKNQYQSTQTTNSGNEKVIVTTANSNIDVITTTVPNYNSQKNKEETTKNMLKTHEEGVVKDETQKNVTTLFVLGGDAMSDYNNESYVKEDSSTKNQYQSTQTTNSGNEKVIVTTADSNIDMITTTVPNYNFQQNKEETKNNVLKTHEEGVVKHETQKNKAALLIHGGTVMTDLNNKSYAKDDSSSKNQLQSTQTTNSGNEKVIVTTEDSNVDMITTTVPNYNFEKNKEGTTKNMSKTLKHGVVKHETQKNVTTLFVLGGDAMSDFNNESYVKEDSSTKNQYQSTQTTNSGNEKVIVTTADSYIDLITTTVPNYNSQKKKEETTKYMLKTHEDGVVKHETQKNITTSFIHGEKAMTGLNNKSYAKDDSSSRNQFQSTQTTNSVNDEFTTSASNIDLITATVPIYNYQQNKDESIKNVPKTHEEGVVKHESKENITTLFIQGGKAMSDLNNESYVKEDSSSKNQYQSTQTTNSGNEKVIVTTANSNIDVITTTVPNYNSQKNKEETTKNMLKTHEEGVVKDETQKNVTTLFVLGGDAMSDYNNESYVKEDSSTKNQYQSTQTTNSGNEKVIVTTADSNIDMITTTVPNYNFQQNKEETKNNVLKTHEEGVVKHETQKNKAALLIHGGTVMTDLNNKSYAKDDSSSKNQLQSTQTTNSGNEKVIVTTEDSNDDMITTTVPNYNFEKNKEGTTKNMSKTLKHGVVKHETQKNVTTLFVLGGDAMSDFNNESYVKEDSSTKNQYQSTQTTNSGNEKVIVTTADSYIDLITTTVPNYNSQKKKEETTKYMLKTHEDGVVKHETQKNITTSFIHGEKAMTGLNNKSYAKDDSSSRNQFQSTQTTNSVNDEFTTSASNIDLITATVPIYNYQQNKDESIKNVPKTHEKGVVKHETQKNITTSFIHGEKATTGLNNKSYAKDDSSSRNQLQSTQTTNSVNDEFTTSASNIDLITATVPNYNYQQNKDESINNVLKTHEKGVVEHETQKNIITSFIHGEKAMTGLNNKSYAKDDSSSRNQFPSTQTTNSVNDEFTTSASNIDFIKATVPNYNSQKNKEETTKNMLKTYEEGVVKHETQKNITTSFIHGEKAMSDSNNVSYIKEDSSTKNQYQSTQTTNSRNEKVIVTTADSNIDVITTTAPNYNSQKNKEETTKNMLKTHEEGVVKHETQKNITLFIHGGKAMSDSNNGSYVKEDSSAKNQYQSTQTTNSGNEKVIVTTADSNIDVITTTVPNYNSQKNKEETTKNMLKTHEEGVVKHETQKNISLFIHRGKAMNDSNNENYVKEDSSTKNQYQSTQTTNSGNENVIVTTADSNIDVITTAPNYNSQKNKEEITKNMLKTHEDGVVKHETQKNITTLFIHGGKAMSDLNNESYAKEGSSTKNQYQSTQTTNSGNEKVIVTTAYSNIITPSFDGEKATSDLNDKSYAKDNSSKILYQSTQTSNQYNFRKKSVLKEELTFNNLTNSFGADKIIAIERNTTITTDVPDFMFTKVDDSGLTTNLNSYTDTFVPTYDSNTHFTKSNIDTDRFDISYRPTTITERNINGDQMTPTHITNDLTFKPKSAPINESKISSETKSSTPISTVKDTNSAHRYFAKTFNDGKLEKNDKPFSNIGQEISSRTNRQAGNQMQIVKLKNNRTMNNYNITQTTTIVSEIPPKSSKKYGEDFTATRVPNYPDVKVSTTISEDFNSFRLKEIGITDKYTMFPVIDAKNLITVAEDFLTTVSTASYNLPKEISTTSISKESMTDMKFVNNGRETNLTVNTNIPQYDETKVEESKSLQTSFQHSLKYEAETTVPSLESDKVTSVLNRAVNTRDVSLLKKISHTENYQGAESTDLSSINLTSLAVSPSNNKNFHTSVTNTLVESATDISANQPHQLKKTKKVFNYFYTTDVEVNENKPNKGIIKSIQSRDITESKASTTSEALRLNEKFRNESILNNNQQSDIIPSELSIKVGSNTLHASTTEKNIAQKISKTFKDIKQNSNIFLSQTTRTQYASSTISSLEKTDRSITNTQIIKNTDSTIRNTNDMSGAPLVTESTINIRKKKSKSNDIAKESLLGNLYKYDGNISSMTSNKYKDLSNNSNSNMTIDGDRQTDNKSKEWNENLEITSERTNFFLINGQKPYKEMSVNPNYHNVSNDAQRVSKYYTNSTPRGSINTTTMAKRIRDVNVKSTNTDPTNVVVILFDYGSRQTQKIEGKSATNFTNFDENPDDKINVDSSSHNRYENSDPNDIKVESMTNMHNADNDNDPQNSSTPKVDGRVNDIDIVICGRNTRGRYPDKTDCRKFYICVGRNPPIRGICPNNTVYSESRKQCTKNLSHCVTNNNFKCLTEGRFSDFLKDDIYHICIKNKLGDYVLYKFQCQNGFRLDKKTVKCIKETENSSSSISSASESSKSNKKNTTERTSKVIDKFECQEEGKFADTRDCRTYYVCSKKRNVYRRKKKKCESDERFDRDKKKCVDAESYECDI